VCLFPEQKFRD